ncbi:MAG: phosphomannomutase/phosphoglucomutase [Desulfarculaceae bacterium]|nr:phosphomannomutase/phosphoglucomutase [Desulfarculaceae bacterium]
MNPNIFREYDIRGVVDKDITESDAELIGRAYGTLLRKSGKSGASVGRDCRKSSERFADRFIKGLLSSGCDVVDIGVCPTPVLYFSIENLPVEAGAMITASHNPPEYNGFKLMNGSDSIHGEGLQEIRTIIEKQDFSEGSGKEDKADALTGYKNFLSNNIDITGKVRIGIDAGNGTGGTTALPVLRELGCEVHDLYCDMDGDFPNHEADPTVKKNLADLIELVKEKKLDLGVGYDGDGDRIGVVDENGSVIYGDQLMVIFAREILERKPGATFISEVKCSMNMYNDIEQKGGRAVMWKTGHSLIKKKMKEENAELAGEMSGHMFFKDRYFGYDDALYATLRLLEIVTKEKTSVSGLIKDLPETFTTPEIRVECPDDKKFEVVRAITAHFQKEREVIDIDGMRALFDGGWGLVRASNTQPALVLRFEAKTEQKLEQIRSAVESILDEIIKES